MTKDNERCVITGLGMVCAIGSNVEESWNNAMSGKSGIAKTTSVDTKDCYAKLAAEVNDDSVNSVPRAEEMDRVSRLCVKAAGEAIEDAAMDMSKEDISRVSVIMGSCVGGVKSIEDYYETDKPTSDIPKMTISAIANQVAEIYGAGGVVTNVANACAASTISIAYACDLIRAGKSDVVIAGGSDAFASVPFAGFTALHALDPEGCSPFNRCEGITLGEGSGVLVVESYEHAKARNARIYCEVLGSGVSSDAHHITAPREDGEGQMHAIRRAIENSGIDEKEIGYINAHGTGTGKNDNAEFLSLHTIFDDKNDNLSVSSTKAMVGHCLGAAGAIEAVFAVKALTENMIPPTLGYTEEDLTRLEEKAGKIDFTPNEKKEKELVSVMSNSFAFGGNNASIIFSKNPGNVSLPEKRENVYITGLGAVTPLGNTVSDYVEAVKNNKKLEEPIACSAVANTDFANYGVKMAFYRKLDKFSQIQTVSGCSALADADITVDSSNATDIGIVVGTADGPISTVCNFQMDLTEKGNAAGSAFKFPNTVYNAAGGYLSICTGIKGYNVTVTNGAQSGLSSIAYGAQVIRQGQEKIILATGTDENSEIITELYNKLGVLSDNSVDAYSGGNGFKLSDGSTTLILESESSMKERNAKAYAQISGYGMAHKSVEFGKLAGSEEALKEAVAEALSDAGMDINDIDAIVGYANGMAAIDNAELDIYKSIFGDRLSDIDIHTIKNTVGEGRAATATLQAAHAALLLHGDLGSESEKYNNILVTSYGSGGSYTAVIVSR